MQRANPQKRETMEMITGFRGSRRSLLAGMAVAGSAAVMMPKQLIYWNELPKGGHFAAFEQPELFVTELRACFGKLR